MSELKSIYESLINAKKGFKPLKETAYNPFFKKNYADMTDVIKSVEGALSENGLGFFQSADIVDGKEVITVPKTYKNKVGDTVPVIDKNGVVLTEQQVVSFSKITTTVFSTSGEKIETTFPLIISDTDPQKLGSAVTYAKRYALIAALGLSVSGEDDDANSVSRPQMAKPAPVATTAQTKPVTAQAKPVTPVSLEEIKRLDGITVTETENSITVSGKTYNRGINFKSIGFTWNSELKAWTKPVQKAAA